MDENSKGKQNEVRDLSRSMAEHSLARLFQMFTDNVQDIIWEVDVTTEKFIFVTPSVQDVLGISPEDVLGRRMEDLGFNQDLPLYRKLLQSASSVTEERKILGLIEVRARTADGRIIWLEVSSQVNRSVDTGRIIWSGISRVVTDRKKRELFNRAIFETLHVISENKNLPVTLHEIATEILRTTGVDAVGIRLSDGERFPYVARAGQSSSFSSLQENDTSPRATPESGDVLSHLLAGEPFPGYSINAFGTYWKGKKAGEDGKVSHVILPLHDINHKVTGVIQLESREADFFTHEGISQLEFLAFHVSELLARKRVESDFRRVFLEMMEGILIGEVVLDPAGNLCDLYIRSCNPSFCKIVQKTETEIVGGMFSALFPETKDEAIKCIKEIMRTDRPVQLSFFENQIDRYIEQVIFRIDKTQFAFTVSDVTERKNAEKESEELRKQLAQTNRMESIGRLAGGVAHDFNNMLQGILGYTEIGLMDISPESPVYEDLVSIQQTVHRAADLTRQLLIFAQRSHSTPQIVEVNAALNKISSLLRSSIGAEMTLHVNTASQPCAVWIDPDRLDQLIINLCMNARDAIGAREGGEITVACRIHDFAQPFRTETGRIAAGTYVVVSVRDNGAGISSNNIPYIFEPFFTTKPKGKGMGLGLSMVYGIVNEMNGGICLASEEGVGTLFEILLPRKEQEAETDQPEKAEHLLPEKIPLAPEKNMTILAVDDEETIVTAVSRILKSLNYSVLATTSSREAVEIFREKKDSIRLILSDVIMPDLRGPDMIAEMMKISNKVPYLYMSGYTENLLMEQVGNERRIEDFVAKPFTLSSLAWRVYNALTASGGNSRS